MKEQQKLLHDKKVYLLKFLWYTQHALFYLFDKIFLPKKKLWELFTWVSAFLLWLSKKFTHPEDDFVSTIETSTMSDG